ncbi:preprotein translocase subunit SecE [Mycoplasmoides alvi]|uniref:preprotein translocase subunit SecE n=1 Tax=Mycoplasmoides alvi TaxID=78580 RepID=UPI00051C3F18|nr:preprotein translocase subunit SecE [Mycoplasmoides alvi]
MSQNNNNENFNIESNQSEIHERSISRRSVLSEYEDPDVLKAHKELKERVKEKRKQEKENYKLADNENVKGEKLGFKFRIKQWWFGMNKESKRISWPTPKYLISSFLIVLLIVAILTGLFFGISEIFVALGILK